MITVIDSGPLSAERQMKIDQQLIDSLVSLQSPLFRHYKWEKKSITYGYFLDPNKYIDTQIAKEKGFDIAKRPTGGGMLFHYSDFSFTVALPASHKAFLLSVNE